MGDTLSLLRQALLPPNLVSIARLALIPFICIGLFREDTLSVVFTALLMTAAGLSDFLDGFLARRFRQVSELGKILDPVSDKLLIAPAVVILVFTRDFPFWLAVLIIGRDLAILLAGVYVSVRQRFSPPGGRGAVPSSNLTGKWTFTFLVSLTVSYFIEFAYGRAVFTWLSVVFLLLSSASYLLAEFFQISHPLSRVMADPVQAFVPAWGRRAALLFIYAVVFAKLFFWLGTDERVSAQARVLAGPERAVADALLEKYAPVLYFVEGEYSFPVEVRAMLENSDLRRDAGFFFRIGDRLLARRPVTAEALKAHSGTGTYLDLSDGWFTSRKRLARSIERRYKKIVYGRVVRDSFGGEDFTVVQYWFFHLLSGVGSTEFVYHEGDWETVSYFLDSSLRPRYAAYSQHFYARVQGWEKVRKEDGHPAVYVSYGGHAPHFAEGLHPSYLDNGMVIPLGNDLAAAGIRWTHPEAYQLSRIDDETDWASYAGRWGGVNPKSPTGPRYRSPRNPALSMWSHPVRWMIHYRALPGNTKKK